MQTHVCSFTVSGQEQTNQKHWDFNKRRHAVDTIQAQDMAVGLQNHVKATFAGGKVMLKHTISGCRAQTQVVDSDYIPKISTLLCVPANRYLT